MIVVSHGGVISSTYRYVAGSRYPGTIANASLSTIRSRDKGKTWDVVEYAACNHLAIKQVGFDSACFGGSNGTA